MKRIREALRVSIAFVHFKYREVAHAHGLKNAEFLDWAQSMAGLGVATALHDSQHYDEKRGNFRHYAVLKTKMAVRSDLRGRSRHNRAIDALKAAIPETMEDDGISPYLTRQEALTVFAMLNDDHRAALSMLDSGYTVEEIAEIMNRNSGNTIYGIIRRAQKKGRELLAELNTPRPPQRSQRNKHSRSIRGDPNGLDPPGRRESHDKRRAP